MQVTKSILCLWTGCAAFAGFAVWSLAYDRGIGDVITMENLDLGGGQCFSLGFPALLFMEIALVAAIPALAGLLVSWRFNKQPLFSAPHAAALLFLIPLIVPLAAALLFR